MVGGRDDLMAYLASLDITPEVIDHPEVFTVEAMMPYLAKCNGIVSKNLFLKDKKKKLWLVSAEAERTINLADIAKKVGASGGLRFADESIMIDKLGVAQGCCTALALFNDVDNAVKFVLDSKFFNGDHDRVYFHPMVNTQTVGLKKDEFRKFLSAIGHEPVLLDF